MTDYEYHKHKAWLSVLRDIAGEYGGRTVDNVIQNIEAIVKAEERRRG